jgi:membrane associated rhomboid family serine protease
VFEQIVLVTAVLLGVTFVRLARRLEAGQRGYTMLVAAVLTLSVAALARGSRFLGVVAVALAVLTVIVPWILEHLARWCFARGRLGVAVRLAGLRTVLMPGAGLSRQQEILQGLALLERDGVDRALDHFRGLADDTEDDGELALINEQIVSMLFYGHRWDEGIAHYESRFHPSYAAMRPALALGLLRAYGESGRIDSAAGLLRALEEGPVGSDPRALGVMSQARLTFLAYAGAAAPVVSALTDERLRLLGLSEASGALFRGIALVRAGSVHQAKLELRRVEDLASLADRRVLDASRSAMAQVEETNAVELEPELRGYVEMVAQRLETFLRAAPRLRRPGSLVVTPLLLVGLLAGYVAVVLLGRGGIGLVQAGAFTPELWAAGSWGRAVLGAFVQADPIGLLINVYAVWLAAPLVERVYGMGRLVLIALGGAILGLVAAAGLEHEPAAVLGGAHLLATAVTVAALWTLLPIRTPGLRPRARRGMTIPLVLVLGAQLAALHRGLLSMDVPAVGLLVAAALAIACVGLLPLRGAVARGAAWLALPLVLTVPIAVFKVAREDVVAYAVAHRSKTITHRGVTLRVPEAFSLTTGDPSAHTPMAVLEGIVDTIALRRGQLVQFVVSPTAERCGRPSCPESDAASQLPALFVAEPSLRHGLDPRVEDAPPAGLLRAFEEAGGDPTQLRSFALRMGGRTVGRVVEREVGHGGAARVVSLLFAPESGVEHAPTLAATLLAGAASAL